VSYVGYMNCKHAKGWENERGGSYVPCSHLRDGASGEVRSWWITCVGLRTGRSVEFDYKRGGL